MEAPITPSSFRPKKKASAERLTLTLTSADLFTVSFPITLVSSHHVNGHEHVPTRPQVNPDKPEPLPDWAKITDKHRKKWNFVDEAFLRQSYATFLDSEGSAWVGLAADGGSSRASSASVGSSAAAAESSCKAASGCCAIL